MREVVIQTLTRDAFAPFGTYEQMDQPQGVALTGDLHAFYPDRMQAPATGHILGFSTITVKRPKRMVIEQVEYHTTTWEMIFPPHDEYDLARFPAVGWYAILGTYMCIFRAASNACIFTSGRMALWRRCQPKLHS